MPQASTQSVYSRPRIDDVLPAAALPRGEVELTGANLGPVGSALPAVLVDGHPAHLLMSRPARLALPRPRPGHHRPHRGPQRLRHQQRRPASRGPPALRGPAPGHQPRRQPLRHDLRHHLSGQRGKQTPVSVVRVSPDGRGTPFVTGILNATGLAFNPEGDLFVTSRAEGNVYRIDDAGEPHLYAEGMGVATGAAFDADGNLFVGDRSGTIFKIDPAAPDLRPRHPRTQRRRLSPGRERRMARSSSPAPPSPPMMPSGPSSRTERRAPGSAAWAVRRAWPSAARATSTSPPASMASAA